MALTSKEKVNSRHLMRLFAVHMSSMIQVPPSDEKRKKMGIVIGMMLLQMIGSLILSPSITLPKLPNLHRTIMSFNESECWNYFETRKEDLPRLLRVLRIPEDVVFDNKATMRGEELMLRGLYELVTGNDQNEVAVVFGCDQTRQSRSLTYFLKHVYSTFLDLLTDNLDWWYTNGYLQKSMEAIKAKMQGGDNFSTCGFIDCNCLECSRPGGGPISDGYDAERWDPSIQKAFYNGWKSIHGLKHQTFDCAYGMTVDMFGPYSLRRNDLKLLRDSRLNQRMRELQVGALMQLTVYGDSIYPRLSHLRSSWRDKNLEQWQKIENRAFTSTRISIEWNYMVTGNLFSYVRNLDKLRLLGSYNVHRVYTVCTILRNCHVALYGSLTSQYFDLVIEDDMLEKYMQAK